MQVYFQLYKHIFRNLHIQTLNYKLIIYLIYNISAIFGNFWRFKDNIANSPNKDIGKGTKSSIYLLFYLHYYTCI